MPLFPEFESLSEDDLRSSMLGQAPDGPEYERVFFGELAHRIAASEEGIEFLHKLALKSSGQKLAGIIDGLAEGGDRIELRSLLIETVASEDEYVLISTLDAARFVRLALPFDRVHELLDAPPSDFVLAAMHRYLAGMKSEDVIPDLISALSHQSPIVRQNAIDELADLNYQPAVQAITGLLNDPDPQVREAAQYALAVLV